MNHYDLCNEMRGERPCVCDVVHAAQALDRRLVRAALTENMRLLAIAETATLDDYKWLGASQALNELLDEMIKND